MFGLILVEHDDYDLKEDKNDTVSKNRRFFRGTATKENCRNSMGEKYARAGREKRENRIRKQLL